MEPIWLQHPECTDLSSGECRRIDFEAEACSHLPPPEDPTVSQVVYEVFFPAPSEFGLYKAFRVRLLQPDGTCPIDPDNYDWIEGDIPGTGGHFVPAYVIQEETSTLPSGEEVITQTWETENQTISWSTELKYWPRMFYAESRPVELRIIPGSEWAAALPLSDWEGSALDPAYAVEITEGVDIYPSLAAILLGTAFEKEPDGLQEKGLASDGPTALIWSIEAVKEYSIAQVLTMDYLIRVEMSGTDGVELQPLPHKTFGIAVKLRPTPTPLPVLRRAADNLPENWVPLLVGLLGILGALVVPIVGYLIWRSQREIEEERLGLEKEKLEEERKRREENNNRRGWWPFSRK
jgi:hypothetical protein